MNNEEITSKQLELWKVKDDEYHVPIVYESYTEKFNDKDVFILNEEHAKLLIHSKIHRQVTPHAFGYDMDEYFSYSVEFIEELESIENKWCAGGAQVVLGRFGLRLHFWETGEDFVSTKK